MELEFRQAVREDIPAITALIKKRIDWMDNNGIHQWNETKYLEVYDRAYFEKNISCFYLAYDAGALVGLEALYETDPRWPDGLRAIYVHHLTSAENGRGIGTALLKFAEREALERGIDLMRLDSDRDNTRLEAYYTALGYEEKDSFTEGLYHGTRREKYLSPA